MKLKTEVHVNIDLHFDSDDLANGAELARLAAVCDGLYMLIKAQRQETGDVSLETPALPQLAASVSQETPTLQQAEPPAPPAVEPEPAPTQRAPFTQPASRSMTFEEYDRLVRAEMKRLSTGGVMPATSAWDRARDPRLPTVAATHVVIPVEPETEAIDGMLHMLEMVGDCQGLGNGARIVGAVITRANTNVLRHQQGIERIESEMSARGLPILGIVPMRQGQDAEARLQDAYSTIAQGVLSAVGGGS